VLGSTVAFLGGGGERGGVGGGGGLTYSQLDEAHQLYLPLPSNSCPELKHATLSRFIALHAAPSTAAASASCLAPHTYKLNAATWSHIHSMLSHTTLHHGSSLLSLARSQYDACMPRAEQAFEELLQGCPAPASPPPPPQCCVADEALQLLRATLVDLWLLMQVMSDVRCVTYDE
jgi:hypothetical protein